MLHNVAILMLRHACGSCHVVWLLFQPPKLRRYTLKKFVIWFTDVHSIIYIYICVVKSQEP